jgi:superfamily II DNA or RNA helicase
VTWQLSPKVHLRNDRVSDEDADRQTRTAGEILRRLDDQPGLVLADEVGMGKTYVALAVAASVLECTRRKSPVVVMVPAAVAEKWPTEWSVFAERCLPAGHGLRASGAVRRGSDFLKLLDDPARKRKHLIFLTHGALTSNLNDPFIRLALLRRATQRRREFLRKRRAIGRAAKPLLNDPRFADTDLVMALFNTPEHQWRKEWARWRPSQPLDDDPVPDAFARTLDRLDLDPLREALEAVPVQHNASFDRRVREARRKLNRVLNQTWTESLRGLDVHLPLLVLDEAHHVKNPNQLAGLFDNVDAEHDAEALQGPLGNMFDKMLFLTATPFQLGHHELLRVLTRFHGVRWPTARARAQFSETLDELGTALDRAQAGALRLERAWGRIDSRDGPTVAGLAALTPSDALPEAVRTALAIAQAARLEITTAESILRPWVIRHTKPHRAQRRQYRPGRSIVDGENADRGLAVAGSSTLPFLLAARAQAVSSLVGVDGRRVTRSFYAYGLASSFEAYADTRRNRVAALDDIVAGPADVSDPDPQLAWYLDRIAETLPRETAESWVHHPKVAATIERVMALWRNGEKVLVFCFYVETGRALRSHISRALRGELISRAAAARDLDPADGDGVLAELDAIGERLLRANRRGYEAFQARVRPLAHGLDDHTQARVVDIVTRFMRTASFLVRCVDLEGDVSVEKLIAGLDRPDLSGVTMAGHVAGFTETLGRRVDHERDAILDALEAIQTGAIAATVDDFDPSERTVHREALLPNVRLANGGVRREARQRLMLGFNTPFFPEVLVASAVMAEGVDLHQDCRHVIHHDLDWNPSTLEQRTGRVDRIGSKAESAGRPVVIYEPYIGGTHDEKMFRVVKDRERWFGIVMGEGPGTSEVATERTEARVPLPPALAEQLTMDLSLRSGQINASL